MIACSYDRPLQLYALLESAYKHLCGIEHIIVIYRASSDAFDALYDQVQRDFPETLFLKQNPSPKNQDFKPLLLKAIAASQSDYVILAADDCVVIDDIDVTRAITLLKQKNAYAFYFNLGANITYTPKQGANRSSQPYQKDAETICWNFGDSTGVWAQSAMIDMTLFKKSRLLEELSALSFTTPPTLSNALHALHQRQYKNQVGQPEHAEAPQQHQVQKRGLAPLHAQVVTLYFNSTHRCRKPELFYDYSPLDFARMFTMGFKIDIDELYGTDTPQQVIQLLPHFVLRHKNPDYRHKHIVVIIPSHNNQNWYQKNLDSVFMQDYDNYDVIYIDDRSSDGTGDLVEKYIQEKGKNNVRLIKNTERCLALKNIYTGVHMCQDDDIVALLDGDDWYAHPHVLSLINDIYQDSQVWLTYGQLAHYPDNTKQTCQPYPEQDNAEYDFRMSHSFPVAPRTFYAGLFWHIDKRDLMYRGKFFEMTSDPAIMLPMLEMARNNHFRFIPIVLYFCNDAPGVVHDRTTNGKLQLQLHNFINGLPSYDAIADYHQDGPLIPD